MEVPHQPLAILPYLLSQVRATRASRHRLEVILSAEFEDYSAELRATLTDGIQRWRSIESFLVYEIIRLSMEGVPPEVLTEVEQMSNEPKS